MSFVLGRRDDSPRERPAGHLGSYSAIDGSSAAPLYVDLDGPHAVLVVGKRGYGKSYTLGVLAEELAGTSGVAPVLVDPMGVFRTLATPARSGPGGDTTGGDSTCSDSTTSDSTGGESDTPAGQSGSESGRIPCRVVDSPAVAPTAIDPRSWCDLLGLSPESGAGTLVWEAAADANTIDGMRERVDRSDADPADRRAAINHLDLAASWDVFDADGLDVSALATGRVTVLDVSRVDRAPANAVLRGVAETLYRGRVGDRIGRLPWILVDEAHTFFDGVAGAALERLLTRGRAPGVSVVLATQRPDAVPAVAVSQSDLLLSHRLTSGADVAALERVHPTYAESGLADRLPERPGEVLIVDDATETVHTARIRERVTPHGGDAPRASGVTTGER